MVSILMWINGHYCFNSLCQTIYLFAIQNNYLSALYIYSNNTMRFPNDDLSSTWTSQCCFKEDNLSSNYKRIKWMYFVASEIQPKRFKMLRYDCADVLFTCNLIEIHTYD